MEKYLAMQRFIQAKHSYFKCIKLITQICSVYNIEMSLSILNYPVEPVGINELQNSPMK